MKFGDLGFGEMGFGEMGLNLLNLPTLKFQQLRGDMIETYKILHASYVTTVTPNISLSSQTVTRGNSLKNVNRWCHYDLSKFSFGNKITNLW